MGGRGALPETEGRLVENVVHFARALRKAGIRVGTAEVADAIRAAEAAGFTRKIDFYHLLRATMVTRAEHLEVFDRIFAMFWRDPEFLESLIRMMSPTVRKPDRAPAKRQGGERRAAEALADAPRPRAGETPKDEIVIDARLTASGSERLRRMDFEQMSAAEAADAAAMIRDLRLPVPPVRSRRADLSTRGRRPDLRATLRGALRKGGEMQGLAFRAPRTRAPDLVALCDISGSMAAYSRMMMHFLHALAWNSGGAIGRVHAFTFGTRLTNVTRALLKRDVDAALEAVGGAARDWEGGTRIGDALHAFNRDWSRRVLGQGAAVLLITDGLERGDLELLDSEAQRLQLSCRRLIWLNPLLRWDDFAPKAGGIRTLLPRVDSLHACHNVDSLAGLARAFDGAGAARSGLVGVA